MEWRKNREQYKRVVMFFISMVLLVLLMTAFGCVWYTKYADTIIQPFFRKGNWLVIGIYGLLLYVFTRIYGGYRIGYLKRGDVIYSGLLSLLFVNAITYLQVSLIGRHFMEFTPMVMMTVCDAVIIVLWSFLADSLYRRWYPPHQMLLIYGNESAESLVLKMNKRPDKYEICEAVNVEEGLDEVFRRIDRYTSVIICDVKSGLRNQILKYCFGRSVRTYLTPKLSDTIVRGADDINLFDTPLLLCRNQGLTIEQRFTKRVMDLLLSSLTVVIALPVMLVVGVAIKLYDRGPIFFRQKRCTINGKEFEVYKFRSMIVDAEKEGKAIPAINNDPRITPIGKFIRKTRLDELPQLINILKGEMSIVGPRPERVEHVEKYTQEIPEFAYRLKVKGGLTGYAQVIGKYNTTALDKLKLDLMYIENYSLLLDIKLILMTIKILFVPESTEGFDKQISVYSHGKGTEKQKSEAREGIGASGNGR